MVRLGARERLLSKHQDLSLMSAPTLKSGCGGAHLHPGTGEAETTGGVPGDVS